jgi:hypothetical protein
MPVRAEATGYSGAGWLGGISLRSWHFRHAPKNRKNQPTAGISESGQIPIHAAQQAGAVAIAKLQFLGIFSSVGTSHAKNRRCALITARIN